MKNLPMLFLGVFATLAFSWLGIVMANQIQFGALAPTSEVVVNPADGAALGGVRVPGSTTLGVTQQSEEQFPRALTGDAQLGRLEYIKLGCLYCHSQQVRREGFGADFERGWGARQTVPRDYIRQDRVLLGTSRTGPDLTNVGERLPDAMWHHIHLYDPRVPYAHSIMPAFSYLYEERPIDPASGPSPKALKLPPGKGAPEGFEIVPTERAEALVAYLLSLRLDYDLPEVRRK